MTSDFNAWKTERDSHLCHKVHLVVKYHERYRTVDVPENYWHSFWRNRDYPEVGGSFVTADGEWIRLKEGWVLHVKHYDYMGALIEKYYTVIFKE